MAENYRYGVIDALGRSSYAVSQTADILRKYWKHLYPTQKEVILRDICEEYYRAERQGEHLGLKPVKGTRLGRAPAGAPNSSAAGRAFPLTLSATVLK